MRRGLLQINDPDYAGNRQHRTFGRSCIIRDGGPANGSTERHCLLIPCSRSYLSRSTAGLLHQWPSQQPFFANAARAADAPGQQRHHLPPSGMSWGEAAQSALADFLYRLERSTIIKDPRICPLARRKQCNSPEGPSPEDVLFNAGSRAFLRWRGSGVPERAAGLALRARTDCDCNGSIVLLVSRVGGTHGASRKFSRTAKQ